MIKDITLGQYFPGNSLIHRLDPRIKIVISIIFITSVFFAVGIYALLIVFAANLLLIFISQINFKVILKAVKPILFLIIFTATINILWTSGEVLLIEVGFVKIYREGVIYALMMVIRLISLVCTASVLITYTTSPTSFTDALERLLNPLKKLKMPVHEFAMMMMIALRFIPTLIDETDKIINAQKARGADFYSGNILKRAKALIPILIPLIVSAFRRAEELATAMECRCYKGGIGRTKMKILKLRSIDFYALILTVLFSSTIIYIRYFL